MNTVGRLAAVLAAMESVMDGCSDAEMTDIVLPGRNVSYNELIEVYEELLQGTRIIRDANPCDYCECNTCSFEKENFCVECDGCEKGRELKNPKCLGIRK